MSNPRTVFERPQAKLVPDSFGPRNYANVSNLLEVTRGRFSHFVCVAVPTELFVFMKEVAGIPPETPVTLALDEFEERFVFSLLAGDDLYDLWSYSSAGVPAWMLSNTYRERRA